MDEAISRASVQPLILNDTHAMLDYFSVLIDRPDSPEAAETARLYPEIAAYIDPEKEDYFEYESVKNAKHNTSLFEHVVTRGIGRKLLGLETGDIALFQQGGGVSEKSFFDDSEKMERVVLSNFMPHFRAAALYDNIAKANPAVFKDQLSRVSGIDMTVVNKAAAMLLKAKRYPYSGQQGLFENMAFPVSAKKYPVLNELAYQLIAMRGYPGQYIRGELNLEVFEPFTQWIRENYNDLAQALSPSNPKALPGILSDIYYLFNIVDTASVREGLFNDELRLKFNNFFMDFENVITPDNKGAFAASWTNINENKLKGFENATEEDNLRGALTERIIALRKSRIDEGEDPEHITGVFRALPDDEIKKLWGLLEHMNGWYVENATSGFLPETQVKLLALSAVMAKDKGVDITQPFHVNFASLVSAVGTGLYKYEPYKIRIIESLLRDVSLEDIINNKSVEVFDLSSSQAEAKNRLGAVLMEIDGEKAVQFNFTLSERAENLVKVLHDLESENLIGHHIILNELVDLFKLRLDDFDRINNEAWYLKTMAAAKSDKKRMMGYVKGDVMEIGPAGGAVLNLLEERKKAIGSHDRIIGLEKSHKAFEDLEHDKKKTGASYELVEGDAFRLREVLREKNMPKLGTVVLCSVLHEIYSYMERDGKKFNIESVKALLGEVLDSLETGGRLIIRDGVIPENGEEVQIMEIKDKASFNFFKSYIELFKGREVPYDIISNKIDQGGTARIKIQRRDAMEYMYTLTWGPGSFYTEVQEQYSVLKRSEYVEMIKKVGKNIGIQVNEVEMPETDREYLQQGYVDNLADKVALYTLDGKLAPFPASNMMIVIEKSAKSQSVADNQPLNPSQPQPSVLTVAAVPENEGIVVDSTGRKIALGKSIGFAMIKPDGYKNKEAIIKQFTDAGMKVRVMIDTAKDRKNPVLEDAVLDGFYAEHKGKPFQPVLKKYMQEGPVVILLLENVSNDGKMGWEKVREIVGDTMGKNPGTIRYGKVVTIELGNGIKKVMNLIHSSNKSTDETGSETVSGLRNAAF